MATEKNRESTIDVGKRLKSFRVRANLTLRQLAKESGVAFTTIQKIESGSISPTVGILIKISRGLGIRINALFEEEAEARSVYFIRRKNRVKTSDQRRNIEAQYIAQNLINPEMFGFHLTVGPGEGSGSEPLIHGGEQIVIGLRGRITFVVGEKRYAVAPGDCLHFKCTIPYRWLNSGKTAAAFYLICSGGGLTPRPLSRI